jgi:hypothetical protein
MAVTIDKSLIVPGKFQVENLIIQSTTGVDLTQVFSEINLYEDLFSSTFTGNLLIQDSNNIISGSKALPILGNELIYIKLSVPIIDYEDDGITEKQEVRSICLLARIYDIEARRMMNNRSQQFILHFIQEEAIINREIRVSKSYINKTYKQVINSIITDLSPANNNIVLEDTRNTYNTIIPNWHPLRAINWLANRSLSPKYAGSTFLFYSTLFDKDHNTTAAVPSNWFVLRTIEDMLADKVRKKVFFQPTNIDIHEIDARRWGNIEDFEIINSFDVLDNIYSGMYASKILTHDIIHKTHSFKGFNYEDSFNSYKHADKGTMLGIMKDRFGKRLSDYPDSLYKFYSTDKALISDNHIADVVLYSLSALRSLHNFRVKFKLPGDAKLNVGDLIQFDMPSPEIIDKQQINDIFYSGKYLVTAIRHTFQPSSSGKYYMTVECAKESLKIDVKDYQPNG